MTKKRRLTKKRKTKGSKFRGYTIKLRGEGRADVDIFKGAYYQASARNMGEAKKVVRLLEE